MNYQNTNPGQRRTIGRASDYTGSGSWVFHDSEVLVMLYARAKGTRMMPSDGLTDLERARVPAVMQLTPPPLGN